MSTAGLGTRVYQIKAELEEIEGELATGTVSRDVLGDFKMAVDHIRLSVWAILAAEQPDEQRGLPAPNAKTMLAEFRLARANEICRNVLADIDARAISADSPDVGRFLMTLQETTERVANLINTT